MEVKRNIEAWSKEMRECNLRTHPYGEKRRDTEDDTCNARGSETKSISTDEKTPVPQTGPRKRRAGSAEENVRCISASSLLCTSPTASKTRRSVWRKDDGELRHPCNARRSAQRSDGNACMLPLLRPSSLFPLMSFIKLRSDVVQTQTSILRFA